MRNFLLIVFFFRILFQSDIGLTQGADAFGPGLNQGQGNQGSSQGKEQKKDNSKNKKPSEEEDFSIDQEGAGDGAPLEFPTQNETGDEFFTSESQGSSGVPSTGVSAFGGGNNTGGAPGPQGTNTPPQQVVPQVTTPNAQSSPSVNQNPAAVLPNANPTPALQSSVSNVPPPVNNTSITGSSAIPSPGAPNSVPPSPPPAELALPVASPSGGEEASKVIVPDTQSLPDPTPNDFSGAPPVPGTMRQMADGEAPETYTVQRGDTLFDICDQLLDEKSYWPKLWSMNPFIRNPHFIFPSTKLRFYPGDNENPPYLEVVTEDDVMPVDKGNLDESELVSDQVPTPALEEEPLSESKKPYVIEVVGPEQLAEDLSDILMEAGKRYRNTESSVDVPGFIFGEEKEPKAYVIGGRYGEISLGTGQRVTLEATGSLESGSLMTVLRKSRDITDPISGEFVGYLYYYVGNITIANQIEDEIYSGIVKSTRLTIRPDDIVVEFISTRRMVPLKADGVPRSEVESSVVAFEYENQLLGAQGQTVFIDKGTKDGVSTGMYFSLFQTPRNLSPDSSAPDLPEDYHMVGLMRVIDVTTEGSVGYILESSREIMLDDRTFKK